MTATTTEPKRKHFAICFIISTISGFTPLHGAAGRGHTDTAKLLLAAGANPSLKTTGGYTALDMIDKDSPLYKALIW